MPNSGESVSSLCANSDVVVLPMMIAPACLRRCDRDGVGVRHVVRHGARAPGRADAGGVDDVLDRNRHAVQRPDVLAACERGVGLAGGGQAPSRQTVMKALSEGWLASIRASSASVSSTAESWRERMRFASSWPQDRLSSPSRTLLGLRMSESGSDRQAERVVDQQVVVDAAALGELQGAVAPAEHVVVDADLVQRRVGPIVQHLEHDVVRARADRCRLSSPSTCMVGDDVAQIARREHRGLLSAKARSRIIALVVAVDQADRQPLSAFSREMMT